MARADLLRLEGGSLCLYGHELDETISPVEADLVCSIQKRRRNEGDFIGAARVQNSSAPPKKRVGIRPEGRAPARDGTVITDPSGREIGKVTSGGFGPSVNGRHGLCRDRRRARYRDQSAVRGTPMPAEIVSFPSF
ncbi:MAG: glycine cleavage T C-terminal barrel domain-containing protein [Hyphomicrobiales bacterium]